MVGKKKEITKAQRKKIGDLAYQGCQTKTIETLTGIPENTLRRRCGDLLRKKRAERKLWLRGVQDYRAENDKNAAVVIFLGKNELDQADKQEHSGPDGGPIPVQIIDYSKINLGDTRPSGNDTE